MICVNSVSVAPGSVTLNVGEWFYGAYAEICPLNADCRNVRWYSDDPDVASVGETSGYICANSAGTARIYAEATDGSGCSDYITVTVSSRIYVESVSLDYSSVSVEEGQSVYIAATVCPGNASNKNLNWSSSNTSVARVSSGVVTAIAKGTARITATAADGSGKSASCLVSVTRDILVNCITVTADKSTLLEGISTCCRATVYPSNADNTNVTWSSENGNIATVCENSGIVTARSAGTTHIYATACDGSGVVGCCQITVTPKIMVSSVEVDPSAKTMKVGDTCCCFSATVYPSNATDRRIRWTSCDCNIAEVDYMTGTVTAKAVGTTCICANAIDGSGVQGVCTVTVLPLEAESVKVSPSNTIRKIGDSFQLRATVYPLNATDRRIRWSSNNNNVATVTTYGFVRIVGIGTALITAKDWNNKGEEGYCLINVVDKKRAVFLIHGRTSNSEGIWGAETHIKEGENNHFDSNLYACADNDDRDVYVEKNSQTILWCNPNHSEGGNLAYYLTQREYSKNLNLFVFNYPNEDAVVHNAEKFEKYIENMIAYVRNKGTDEMKACFYDSPKDYEDNKYKFNIVGHSMGGLVARYYIENLGHDENVDKLITICTPHWGDANLVGIGTTTGIGHCLCDHDLENDSAMYGGDNSVYFDESGCPNIVPFTGCIEGSYTFTDELRYSNKRYSTYYSIAGIDYDAEFLSDSDYFMELTEDYSTYSQLSETIQSKADNKLYTVNYNTVVPQNNYIEIRDVDDNLVGFLSQIGWTKNDADMPNKKISFYKIFINIDTNGGNSIFDHFHEKMVHRNVVMEKVYEYLTE